MKIFVLLLTSFMMACAPGERSKITPLNDGKNSGGTPPGKTTPGETTVSVSSALMDTIILLDTFRVLKTIESQKKNGKINNGCNLITQSKTNNTTTYRIKSRLSKCNYNSYFYQRAETVKVTDKANGNQVIEASGRVEFNHLKQDNQALRVDQVYHLTLNINYKKNTIKFNNTWEWVSSPYTVKTRTPIKATGQSQIQGIMDLQNSTISLTSGQAFLDKLDLKKKTGSSLDSQILGSKELQFNSCGGLTGSIQYITSSKSDKNVEVSMIINKNQLKQLNQQAAPIKGVNAQGCSQDGFATIYNWNTIIKEM